jgi:cytochrome P450
LKLTQEHPLIQQQLLTAEQQKLNDLWDEHVRTEFSGDAPDKATGENEIVSSYTAPLPVRVIVRLLGIPGEDYDTFKCWSDVLLTAPSKHDAARIQLVQEMTACFGKTAAAAC